MRLLGRDPSLDELIPYRERQRIIPVAVGRAIAIPGKSAPKMALEIPLETRGRHFCVFVFCRPRAADDLKCRHFRPCIADAPKPPALRVPWALCVPLSSELSASRTGSPLS